MDFQIMLGGTCFSIHNKYWITKDYYSEFLADWENPSVSISLSSEEIKREWRESPVYDEENGLEYLLTFEPTFERLATTRKILELLPSFSMVLMHGVVVCDNSYAYMFTAPSGIGKTTRAELFLTMHPDGFILNGDKPIIKVERDCLMAYGTPWKGKENYGINAEMPLKAIFLLERADKIEIEEVSISDAFDFLISQAFLPCRGENILRSIQLIKSFDGKVRLFRYRSPATAEAVEAAYLAANKD